MDTIYVAGTLEAEGVEFTRTDTGTGWEYMGFDVEGEAVSHLESCTFRNVIGGGTARYAVHVFSGSPDISGATFIDCPADIGLYIQANLASPDIHSCAFTGFSDCAVFVLGGTNPTVTSNTFSNNGYGITFTDE